MVQKEFSLKTADGLSLYAQSWQPIEKEKAAVCLVHGIGEHSGRYQHVAAALVNAGYAMMGFDFRGHGKSEGLRGHVPSLEAVFGDIELLIAETRGRFSGVPLFIYGHSMGGLVLNYLIEEKPDLVGAIVTSPNLRLAFEPPAFKVALGKMMDKILPTFTQASELDTEALSRDPTVARAYNADPLVHDQVSARLFVSVIYEASQWSMAHAEEIALPLLLMHGSSDRLTSADASRKFAEKAGDCCTLKIWDGFYHELHNEPEKAEVLKYIINWIDKSLEVIV